MKLTIDQIKNIVLNNPGKSIILKAQERNKKRRMHLYGENLKNEISEIKGHEKPELRELRQKYATSNKPLFSRLLRPVDKVFSARGGSVYFNLTDVGNKKAMQMAMNVKDGLSVRKWIENKWKPHLLDDPDGLLFIELPSEPQDDEIRPYPTYKSIQTIHDYDLDGSIVEFVSFKVSTNDKVAHGYKAEDTIFRVVDDAFDYWIKVEGETITILSNQTFPNYFGKVPAIRNSDLVDSENDQLALSLIDDVIDIADSFLQDGSIRNLAKIRMAYPKYWEYADDCNVCGGVKEVNGEKCTTCKGTGKKIMLNPGDVKLMAHPETKEDPIITPNVAGFVPFPKDYFDNATQELQSLENIAHITLWGAQTPVKTQGPVTKKDGAPDTATQVLLDKQPEIDRLHIISDMAEKRHKFIIDHIIQLTIDSSYKGSSVNYGRRYMMETPDEIWDRYAKARGEGAAISLLDDLLMEYIETKYNGDPVGMNIQLKLLVVEPFVHYTAQDAQKLALPFEDYNRKLFFGEWLATLNEAMLLSFSTDELKAQLTDYVDKKKLVEPAPVKNAALN